MHGTMSFTWEIIHITSSSLNAGPVLCTVLKGSICPRDSYAKEKWEDQNQYGWMKVMKTLGNWVNSCGEASDRKSEGNPYQKPRVFMGFRLEPKGYRTGVLYGEAVRCH